MAGTLADAATVTDQAMTKTKTTPKKPADLAVEIYDGHAVTLQLDAMQRRQTSLFMLSLGCYLMLVWLVWRESRETV